MKAVLKNFLEKPGVLKQFKEFIIDFEKSDETSIKHLIQGSLWMGIKKAFQEKNVLPIAAYYGDFNKYVKHSSSNKEKFPNFTFF